jgi:hypothetical protein
MTRIVAAVPVLLWRGELRAQGLLLRRPLITAAQTIVGLVILTIVALRVRDQLTSGAPVRYLNVTVVWVALAVLMAANVTLLGERTGTLPWQLQRWAANMPIGSSQLARLIVVFSTLRSGLLTLALLGAVAVGALSAVHSPSAAATIIVSAVLLPLLPVAVGLQWARRRGTSVSFAFTLAPLAVAVSAINVPLPTPAGWPGTLLEWTSLPALVLVGRASPADAIVLLAAWTGAALVLLRPAALSMKDASARRGFGSLVHRLGRIPVTHRPGSLVLDIAVHKVRATDLLEILFLGTVSCSVVALEVFASGTVFGVVALAAAVSTAASTATLAGYIQMKANIGTDDSTEAWIRALPIPAPALSVARHAVCTTGAALAVLPVMVLAVIKMNGPLAPGAVLLALWAALSAWSLTGWFASYLSARAWRKHLRGYSLFAWFGIRGLVGAAVLTTARNPLFVAGLFAVDILIGLAGHWRGATAASRSWE